MSDFNDRPLVAGSVVGVRAFDVDKLGRLTGVTHKAVFKPGENVAVCRRDEDVASLFAGSYGGSASPTYTYRWGLNHSVTAKTEVEKVAAKVIAEKPTHTVAALDCQCGYYAFFTGDNDYGNDSRVTGIVEGYGTCTVGSRGFRAEKARLLALVVPEPKKPAAPEKTWGDMWLWERLRHRWECPSSVHYGTKAGRQWRILAGDCTLWPKSKRPAASMASFGFPLTPSLSSAALDMVRRNYPDVPVFPTLAAAKAAFPLTEPDLPTPENTPDFWEVQS